MALTDSTPQTTDDDAQARRRRTPRSIAKNSRAVPFKLAAKEERFQLLDDARSALRGELRSSRLVAHGTWNALNSLHEFRDARSVARSAPKKLRAARGSCKPQSGSLRAAEARLFQKGGTWMGPDPKTTRRSEGGYCPARRGHYQEQGWPGVYLRPHRGPEAPDRSAVGPRCGIWSALACRAAARRRSPVTRQRRSIVGTLSLAVAIWPTPRRSSKR